MSNTVSATIGRETYQTQLDTEHHHFIGDEPLSSGGTDLGPAPGELLRLALASCTAITLRMYANRKRWNVEKIKVNVSTETIEGKTIFYRDVHIEGNVDDTQREQLLQIANSCPIHKVLTNPIEVDTEVLVNR